MIRFIVLFFSLAFLSIGYYYRNPSLSIRHQRTPEGNRGTVEDPKKEQEDLRESHHFDRACDGVGGMNALDGSVPFGVHPLKYSSIGWILLGIYWLMQTQYYLDIKDFINAILCVGALPFFGYLSYREWQSVPSGGLEGLRFLSGVTIISLAGYTLVSAVPIIEGLVEYLNAYIVAAFLTLFGFPAEAGEMDFSGNPLWYRTNDLIISVPVLHDGNDEILITLSCTAIGSMLLFGAAIFSARESRKRKVEAFLLTVPVIFILNIVRQAMITYLTYSEMTSPEFAHNILGKFGSLLALLFLAWVLFTYLPSVLEGMQEIFDVLVGKRKTVQQGRKMEVGMKRK